MSADERGLTAQHFARLGYMPLKVRLRDFGVPETSLRDCYGKMDLLAAYNDVCSSKDVASVDANEVIRIQTGPSAAAQEELDAGGDASSPACADAAYEVEALARRLLIELAQGPPSLSQSDQEAEPQKDSPAASRPDSGALQTAKELAVLPLRVPAAGHAGLLAAFTTAVEHGDVDGLLNSWEGRSVLASHTTPRPLHTHLCLFLLRCSAELDAAGLLEFAHDDMWVALSLLGQMLETASGAGGGVDSADCSERCRCQLRIPSLLSLPLSSSLSLLLSLSAFCLLK